jgi:hypothetical protein
MSSQSQKGTGAKPQPGKKLPSAFQIWFEDAWGSWLKHVALILFAGLLFLIYKIDLFNERVLGLMLSLGVAFGALVMAAVPAREHIRTGGQRAAFYLLCAVWAVCAAYPIIYGIFPGRALASGMLGDEGSTVTLDVPDGGKAVHVVGKLRGGGEAIASYKITGSWQGGSGGVEGQLSRAIAHVRVGRRGSGSQVTEHNEDKQYLGRTHGQVTLKLEQKDENLEKELAVELRPAPLPPLLVMLVSGLLFVFALALDRVLDPKGRTSLGVSAAVSLLFASYFGFFQAHPRRVVQPAIGSFFVAIIAGGVGGWLIAAIVKKLTPEKKKRPARA